MKIINPEWEQIGFEPIDIAIRKLIGMDLDLDKIDQINVVVDKLLRSADDYRTQIERVCEEEIYNYERK